MTSLSLFLSLSLSLSLSRSLYYFFVFVANNNYRLYLLHLSPGGPTRGGGSDQSRTVKQNIVAMMRVCEVHGQSPHSHGRGLSV